MDLVRAEILLGGPELDPLLVESLAVRQFPDAIRALRPGTQSFDIGQHRLETGAHRSLQRRDGGVEKALLFFVGNLELVHLAAEILEQRRVLAAVVEWARP